MTKVVTLSGMKIIRIKDNNYQETPVLDSLLSEEGIEMINCGRCWISSFTAMKVSKLIDKVNAEVVIASSISDIMAAVSATKICKKKGIKVIAEIQPDSKPPKGIPSELCDKVNLWIFPSEYSSSLYNGQDGETKTNRGLHKRIILPPAATEFKIDSPLPYPQSPDDITLLWVGTINDKERLKEYISRVDALDGKCQLRICGTGRASEVMPVVKWSRSLKNKERIIWLGEDYNIKEELQKSHAALKTANDTTPEEIAALKAGREILTLKDIDEFVSSPHATSVNQLSNKEYESRLAEIYKTVK